ncbi:MAG: ATP-binding protein [bacterium]|nr:ATP-binding protein [bacterium]
MFFKRFRVQVILRTFLLVLSIGGLSYLLLRPGLYLFSIPMIMLIIYQVYAFIRYVEKTNQDLSRFLMVIKQGDFARSFSGKEMGPSFAELITLFNDVMEKIKQSRSEKEEQYRYLQTIIHHVGIGLIAFRSDGSVDMINNAAKRILKVGGLRNIKSLGNLSQPLADQMMALKHGDRTLVKIDAREMELAIHAAEFRLKDEKFTLVSLQDIQSELQEKELEAWQTLIRVLIHEIMNSMTPITSMAATVIDLLDSLYDSDGKIAGNFMDIETIADIGSALKTIHKRSTGLTHFVKAYRNLALIPKPQFKILPIEELFSRVEKLLESKLNETGIQLQWIVDPRTLELTADPGLIEQVLLNLLLNAVDALETGINGKPRIDLTGKLDESGGIILMVADNGPGIAKEALQKVFIPFFTTKKKGSGIGLSLSRQIMKLHGGVIRVHSKPDVETVFTLKF